MKKKEIGNRSEADMRWYDRHGLPISPTMKAFIRRTKSRRFISWERDTQGNIILRAHVASQGVEVEW